MLEPETFTVAQVPLTVPAVHPVVRPTLFTVPLKLVAVFYCAVIVKMPDVVSDPVFTPVVFAINPRVEAVPEL